MRAGLALIVLAFGCGGSKPQPAPPNNPPTGSGSDTTAPPTPPPVAAAAPTPETICRRMMELKTQRCGEFGMLEIDEPTCVSALVQNADNPNVEVLARCVPQPSCQEVTGCLAAAQQNPPPPREEKPAQLRACADKDSFAPVGLPKAEWDKRNGASAKKFSEVKSTKDLPVEMCGISAENRWLESLSCDDGSKPVGQAEMVRVGNVGPGGRCGSIIDQYNVTCPGGKQYPIFIDAYVCAKP